MEEKKAKLHIAEQAEALKPYADALTKAENQLSQALKEKQEAENQLLHQRTIYDQMTQNYEQARQKKIETEPELLQKKEQLLQLKEIERKKRRLFRKRRQSNSEKRYSAAIITKRRSRQSPIFVRTCTGKTNTAEA